MDVWDVIVIIGLGSLGYGLWLLAPWISLSVVGAFLIAFGLLGARMTERSDRQEQS